MNVFIRCARFILQYSCSYTVVISRKSDKRTLSRIHLTPGVSNDLQQKLRLSRVPWLLRPAPSLQRSRSVPRPVVLHAYSSPVQVLFLLSLQVRAQANQPCNPNPGSPAIGFLHWSRGPCSRAAGDPSHTGAILKARSTGGGASGSTLSTASCRSVATPKAPCS